MTEGYLYEAEEFKARSKESGKIVYYKTKDAMDAAIKDKKAEPIEKGDDKDDKPDTKKGMDIDTTGGLGDEPEGEPSDEEPSDEEPSGEEESPEARLEKIDSEIEDIEDQREILKQYMTSSGMGGVSRSRRDQLEKEDKELLAKWRELQWARDDIQDEIDAKGEQEESISINGQKYRPIKESKQHILKENYERFFGSRK